MQDKEYEIRYIELPEDVDSIIFKYKQKTIIVINDKSNSDRYCFRKVKSIK